MSARQLYFALCPLPLACLLISYFVPGDTHATAAAARHPFDWLMLAILGSPILSLFGFAMVWAKLSEGQNARAEIIATAVAALPTLFFLASTLVGK